MKSNAFHYNEAKRDIERSKELSADDIKALIATSVSEKKRENWAHEWSTIAISATEKLEANGKYPYLDDVARGMAEILGVDVMDDKAWNIIKDVAYATSGYSRALKTIQVYERFWSEGFISIHDTTEEHNNKEALLSGKGSVDLFSFKKENEPVKIVVMENGARGYRKPRMRTRFFRAPIDADLFVKLA